MLFKDEVRACGDSRLAHDMVYRQPFPGPGLGVRCLGAITRDRLEAVRNPMHLRRICQGRFGWQSLAVLYGCA